MKNIFKSLFTLGIVITVTLFFQIKSVNAQFDRTLYFLPSVPQGRNLNPGFIPEYKFFVGVPIVSSVRAGFDNSFSYEDVILRDEDKLVVNLEHILSNVDDNTNINIGLMTEYITFGFVSNKNYFHFRVADILESHITINKELIRLLHYGNGGSEFLGNNVDIGGNNININYYREYSLGYARQINDKLSIGGSLKYLQGIANVNTPKTDIEIYTDEVDFGITIRSNIEMNISIPGIDDSEISTGHFLPNPNNRGFAFDIGGQYIINNKFDVFASVLNVGSIKWTDNLKNYKTEDPNGEFVFEGFDISEYFENGEINDERIENIIDSIVDEFGIVETSESYKTKLHPILNIGLNYNLTEKDEFGLLIRTQFHENRNLMTASLGYTRKFGENLNVMISNSFFNDSFFNPGIGFAANIGPVQLYLINENITAPFILDNSHVFILRFGINLIFDGKSDKQSKKEAEVLDDAKS